jgi:hypothetical protein
MPERLWVCHPDDPEGVTYDLAPEEITRAIQRRLERRVVVVHPEKPNVYIYDPENFWDGATEVTYDPERGMFSFSGWTGEEHFPLIGPLR